jgi:predicted amidophosphoribosyltransferase
MWKYVGDEAYHDVVERWIHRSDLTLPLELHAPFIPVPLHVTRRRERGFDQAERFAEQVSTMTGRPVASLLTRVQRTSAQAQRGHAERLVGDLDGIFRVTGEVPEAVILCDDVFTSGATMDAAAKCLKEAGAETVWGLVIARG